MQRRIAWAIATALAVLLSFRHFLGLPAAGFLMGFGQWLVLRPMVTAWYVPGLGLAWLAGLGLAVLVDTPASGLLVGLLAGAFTARALKSNRKRLVVASMLGCAAALFVMAQWGLEIVSALLLGVATAAAVPAGAVRQRWIPIGLAAAVAGYLAWDSISLAAAEPVAPREPHREAGADASPPAVGIEDSSGDGWTLRHYSGRTHAYLFAPKGADGPLPLVVFVQGSGWQSVLGFAKRRLAPHAARRGFRLLALDKVGVAPTDGRSPNPNPTFFRWDYKGFRVEETVRVVRLVSREKPPAGLHLIGYSEGADVAAAVARRIRPDSLVLMGGGGYAQSREFKIAMRKLMRTGAELIDRIDGRLIDSYVDAEVRRVLADPVPDRYLMGLSHLRWATYLRSPPIDDLREAGCRILLLHGARDLSTPVESARYVAAELPQATLREYDGLDHDFRDERGRDHLPEALGAAFAWMFPR